MKDLNAPYVGPGYDEATQYGEWRQLESGLYDVLDNGYLKVIETWGSDERIIETARMSTDKGFLGWDAGVCPSCSGTGYKAAPHMPCHDCGGKGTIPGDAKLLRYLYEHKHSTPFEFAGLTIEIQAPIMVYREWHRHRTQAYSEMSARYVQMPNLHYVPSIRRIIESSRATSNRQASGKGFLRIPGNPEQSEEKTAAEIRHLIRAEQSRIYSLYEQLLSFGVAKEIARVDTPVARYSRMRATGNLRNWLHFLTLRMDKAAQFEIRQYAWALSDVIASAFPRTWELALEGMAPKKVFTPDMLALLQTAHDQIQNITCDFVARGIVVPEALLGAEKNLATVLQGVPR